MTDTLHALSPRHTNEMIQLTIPVSKAPRATGGVQEPPNYWNSARLVGPQTGRFSPSFPTTTGHFLVINPSNESHPGYFGGTPN